MKKFLFLFAGLLFFYGVFFRASQAFATPTFIQATTTAPFGVTFSSKAFKNNVAKGDLIVIGTFNLIGDVITATDTLGDTFVRIAKASNASDHDSNILVATTTSAGPDTITVSDSVTNGLYGFSIHEYSGTQTDSIKHIIDASSSAISGTVLTTGNMTTASSGDLIFGYFATGNANQGNAFIYATPLFTGREISAATTSFCGTPGTSNCMGSEDAIQVASGVIPATSTLTAGAGSEIWTGVGIAVRAGSGGGGGGGCTGVSNTTGTAWGNTMGWVSFPNCGGFQVSGTTVTGYAWSETYGWINFGPLPSSTGVTNDGTGVLGGFAWNPVFGYIGFTGVTINASGTFQGIASGTAAGTLVFDTSTGCTFCHVTTTWTPPGVIPVSVSGVTINTAVDGNNPTAITLTANATTSVNINATIQDNSCSQITGGTTTVLFYRSAVTSSSCFSGSGNGVATSSNCYLLSAFTATSTCSSGIMNMTTTVPVQYFAQPTDSGSPYNGQNWMATVIFTDTSSSKASADSTSATTTDDISTLAALNSATANINYGSLAASSTTGATNQQTVIQNVGNSTTTLSVFGTALVTGTHSISTSSQHYASSTFTFGGNEQLLSAAQSTITGVNLATPTSTTAVSSPIFWGVTVPSAAVSGTYSGTLTFVAGGGNASGQSYTTNFLNTENPLSESGEWIEGSSTGLDWSNDRSTPGMAFGTQTPASVNADSEAILSGAWNANQSATGKVVVSSTAGWTEEVELRLRSTMTPHNSSGYEITCSVASTYLEIVRWNGGFASFNVLADAEGSQPRCQNGDVLSANASGSKISIYLNGTFVTSTIDATYATGSPGMGFFMTGSSTPADATFGFSSYTATST